MDDDQTSGSPGSPHPADLARLITWDAAAELATYERWLDSEDLLDEDRRRLYDDLYDAIAHFASKQSLDAEIAEILSS